MSTVWNLEHSGVADRAGQKDPETPGVFLEECSSFGVWGGKKRGWSRPGWSRAGVGGQEGGAEILDKSVQREESSELWCVRMSVHRARLLHTHCRSVWGCAERKPQGCLCSQKVLAEEGSPRHF